MESSNENKKLIFPNRNFSSLFRFYSELVYMNSPNLKELEEKILESLHRVDQEKAGQIFKLDNAKKTAYILVTDFLSETDFKYLKLIVLKRFRDPRSEELLDGIAVCRPLYGSNLDGEINLKIDKTTAKLPELKLITNGGYKISKISLEEFIEVFNAFNIIYRNTHNT